MPLLQNKKSVAVHQSAAGLHDGPSAADEAAQAEQEQAEVIAAPAAGAGPAAVEQEVPAAAAEASAGATSGKRQKSGKRAPKAATRKGGKTDASKEAPSAQGLPASSAAERDTDIIASAEPGQHQGELADHAKPAAAVDGQQEADQPAKRATANDAKDGPNNKNGAAKGRKSIEPVVDEAATAAVQGQAEAAVPAAAVAAASADAVEQQSEAAAAAQPGAGRPEVPTAQIHPAVFCRCRGQCWGASGALLCD